MQRLDPSLFLLIAALAGPLGCSGQGAETDEADESSEGALSATDAAKPGARRAELSRTLKPELPVPRDTAIGKKIAEILEEAKKGHKEFGPPIDENGCRQITLILESGPTFPTDGSYQRNRTGDVTWQKCTGPDPHETVWVSNGQSVFDVGTTYEDQSGDGIVDGFYRPYHRVVDRNADGRVDRIEEWGDRLQTSFDAYPGWTPPSKPSRTLEDTDDSGGFDKETIGASGASSWWRKL